MNQKTFIGLCIALIGAIGLLAANTALAVTYDIYTGQPIQTVTQGTYGQAYGTPIYRNLGYGTSGADVSALQSFLTARGYYAPISGYFDAQTSASVARYQAAHGIPSTGFFGPLTRGAYNAELYGSYGTNGYPGTPGYPVYTSCPPGYTPTIHNGLNACVTYNIPNNGNNNNSNNGNLRSGEADLRNFDVQEGNDSDLSEGDTDDEVLDASFDVDNGDVEIRRAEFQFEFTGDNSNADSKPWKVFDRARLLSDGKEIASMNVDDQDSWSKDSTDTYDLEFDSVDSNIIREGDSADLTLELDVNDNVKGSDNGDASWDISVTDEGIKTIDGDGNTSDIGDEGNTVSIDINNDNNDNNNNDNNNSDDELVVSSSSESPDQGDIDVSRSSTSDWEPLLAFKIKARGDDIDLNSIPVTLDFLDGGSYDDYISDIKLDIDGQTYDDTDVDDNNDNAVVTFNINGDETINEDDSETATVYVKFKKQSGNYSDGDEIQASIDSDNVDDIDAEGNDSLDSDQLTGSAEGETQTLNVN